MSSHHTPGRFAVTRGWSSPLLIWAIFRLPLLAIAAYLLSPHFLRLLLEASPSGGLLSRIAYSRSFWTLQDMIFYASTVPIRALLGLTGLIIISVGFMLFCRPKPFDPSISFRWAVAIIIAFLVFLAAFYFLGGSWFMGSATFLAGILALNTLPDNRRFLEWTSKGSGRRLSNWIFGSAVGFSEFFLTNFFFLWLSQRFREGGHRDEISSGRATNYSSVNWLPATLCTSAIAALLLSTNALIDLQDRLYSDPRVTIFARGNYNWITLNRAGTTLFAIGHGFSRLQAFDVNALETAPRQSSLHVGLVQSFAYNPKAEEIYIFSPYAGALLCFDAHTLEFLRAVRLPEVAGGDSWIVWDPYTDEIIIASEADTPGEISFISVNRETGQVEAQDRLAVGNIFLHPEEPFLYMSYFRSRSELLIYDTRLHRVVKTAPTHEPLDRMAVVPGEDELLVASPTTASVRRYNARTLEKKGEIKTLYGVRSLAVDPLRRLLFCGSLIRNTIEVVDLNTYRSVTRYYVGPWVRTISLDVNAGVAYVSTYGRLARLQYSTPSNTAQPDKAERAG